MIKTCVHLSGEDETIIASLLKLYPWANPHAVVRAAVGVGLAALGADPEKVGDVLARQTVRVRVTPELVARLSSSPTPTKEGR